jgi:hypothetical protein
MKFLAMAASSWATAAVRAGDFKGAILEARRTRYRPMPTKGDASLATQAPEERSERCHLSQ